DALVHAARAGIEIGQVQRQLVGARIAGDHQNGGALGAQHPHGRRPDPARPAGHHTRLAVQSQIHDSPSLTGVRYSWWITGYFAVARARSLSTTSTPSAPLRTATSPVTSTDPGPRYTASIRGIPTTSAS